MHKIELYLDEKVFLALQKYAHAVNLNPQEVSQQIIAAHTLLFTEKNISNEVQKHITQENQDEFDELKELMGIYNITQLDLASFLKITQAGVSFAITKRKKSSIMFQMVEKLGLEKFLLRVLQHKYLTQAEIEIMPNNSNIDFIDYSYKGSSSYMIVRNWAEWKKILFGYIINVGYMDEDGRYIQEDEIFETIDHLSEDEYERIVQAEKEGLDSYISTLRHIYENKEL